MVSARMIHPPPVGPVHAARRRDRLSYLLLALATAFSACGEARESDPVISNPAPPVATEPVPAARASIAMTYLGVAGWQVDAGERTFLMDPYFSRPDLSGLVIPDLDAISARAPAHAELIMIGHSHVDHLLDAPTVAVSTGASIMGSLSTARVASAAGVPADQIIPIQGGEDYQFDGYSVRVIPSLHSALDDKHTAGATEIAESPTLPMRMDDYAEGGAFAYLLRVEGHEIFFLSTANFIEREVEGLRPDIAVIATGLREEIYDYTCRLLRALGGPPLVYANHFDDWHAPPVDEAPDADLEAFIAEAARCYPDTRVVIPHHFERMEIP